MIEALVEEALKLPVKERAELIARLLDSLEDVPPDEAWTEVIEKRLQEGNTDLVDAEQVMAQARAVVAARRRGE